MSSKTSVQSVRNERARLVHTHKWRIVLFSKGMQHPAGTSHVCMLLCVCRASGILYVGVSLKLQVCGGKLSQLLWFCLNSDKLTLLGAQLLWLTRGARARAELIQRLLASCVSVFADGQVRAAFSLISETVFSCLRGSQTASTPRLERQGPWPRLSCSCLQPSTHCCSQGWGPAAGLLCVCTSAECGHAAGLGACRGA